MESLRTTLINALLLQLLMSIAALPFLLWWHIPYPLLSILGNLLHPIFLTVFLFLASILFFAAVLGLSPHVISSLLTQVTAVWNHILDAPIPPGWIALHWWYLIPAVSALFIFAVYTAPKLHHLQLKKTLLLILALNGSAGLWHLQASKPSALSILRKGNEAILFVPQPDNSIDIIDQGYVHHARDTKALIHYDILPHIFFTYGTPMGLALYGSKGSRMVQARKILTELGQTLKPMPPAVHHYARQTN